MRNYEITHFIQKKQVQHGTSFYEVDVFDESGAALSPEIIQSSLIEIVRQNDKNDPPVGALTTLPRDEWASVRVQVGARIDGNIKYILLTSL